MIKAYILHNKSISRKRIWCIILTICISLPFLTSCESFKNAQELRNEHSDYEYMSSINMANYRYVEEGKMQFGPILETIEYDGYCIDYYLELRYSDFGRSEKIDAVALFFLDGYLLKTSFDDGNISYVNTFSFETNVLSRFNFKCFPEKYCNDLDKHMITSIVIPNYNLLSWESGIRDNVIMTISKEIDFPNPINGLGTDNVKMMDQKDFSESNELLFSVFENELEIEINCYEQGDVYCYLFGNGELVPSSSEYIVFSSQNNFNGQTSYAKIDADYSTNKNSIFFVLYVNRINYNNSAKSHNYLLQ